MTDQPTPDNDDQIPEPPPAPEPTDDSAPEPTEATDGNADSAPEPETPAGERIAKVMARAGVASRREAERMILEGRVIVNGRKIASPALDILPTDQVRIDGKPMEAPQETRLWLYYKPVGLVTSESDEKGRQTVFDALPRDLPRVMSVGRLDLNSEGLLLLTNDGELKRRLELPATAWLRRYRVRVNGNPTELTFDPLRRGATIDGEDFAPMEIKLDSQQGANAWLTVGIREGRNREIRRAMAHVGLQVNRLIRIGYGPFKLAGLEVNEVREVKRRILRDQLGGLYTGETEGEDNTPRRPRASGAARDMGLRPDRPPRRDAGEGERPERKPRMRKAAGERPEFRSERPQRDGEERRPFARRDDAPRGERPQRDGERGPRPAREGGFDRKPRVAREGEERRPYARRDDGPRGERPQRDGERGPRPAREGGFDRKPRVARDGEERRPYARRDDAPRGERPQRDERGPRPAREGGFDRKPRAARDGEERRPYAGRDGEERRPSTPRRAEGDRPERAAGKGFSARSERGDARPGGKSFGARGAPRPEAGRAEGSGPRKGGGFKPGFKSSGPGRSGPANTGPRSGGPRGSGPKGAGPGRGGPKPGPKGGARG
ncbi:23S rRNA pseudouridine2605 synthase [Paracoccus solventivorans]|uniref:Pseudouridine synthase n=1 Tax=Paracoccus solventivorans TaxID=53463 RepID=A0A1M7FNN9_9RHOB|nr:pseudouridine synthase [Paracoccus solventivorans]SHM05319.1 23S rRNA pseudouridine2605 synthase [Paracoccus solventivorans]